GVERLSGVLDARVEIAGTLTEPRIAGALAAADLMAELPPLGIDVTDGRLVAGFADPTAVPFEGELCSGGCAQLRGTLSLPSEGDWSLAAQVEGENVLLADLPD